MTSPNYAMVSGWKKTQSSKEFRYTDLELVYVSFLSRRNIVLIWKGLQIYFYIFYIFTSISSLMAIYLKCSKYSSISWLTWFMRLVSVSEPTDGIPCDFTKNSKLFYNRAYEARELEMKNVRYLLFWMSIWTFTFSNYTSFLLFFPNSSNVPLYFTNHSYREAIDDYITSIFLAWSSHLCWNPCKWKNTLCMIKRS